jgi:hypothetical protein
MTIKDLLASGRGARVMVLSAFVAAAACREARERHVAPERQPDSAAAQDEGPAVEGTILARDFRRGSISMRTVQRGVVTLRVPPQTLHQLTPGGFLRAPVREIDGELWLISERPRDAR